MDDDVEEKEALVEVAVLEALLEELADEEGPDYAQRILLGDAAPPPAELLREIRDARRDLALIRQNQYLARLLACVESVEKNAGQMPNEVEQRVRRALAEHPAGAAERLPVSTDETTMTVAEAAGVLHVSVKTLQNRISAAKRSGRELDWVLRAGRRRGCAVHRDRFHAWLEQQPRRRGRPAGS